MFEEDGIDYTANSRSYAFAQAAVGSTVNYGMGRKKPTRKKKETSEKRELTEAQKKFLEERELSRYYKAKYDKSKINNGDPLDKGSSYIIDDRFFKYIGEFKSVKDVPNTTCCFIVGDMLYTKNQVFDEEDILKPKSSKRKPYDDAMDVLRVQGFLVSHAKPGDGCVINLTGENGSVECARTESDCKISKTLHDKRFVKTKELVVPHFLMTNLGMKNVNDKPDPGKALDLLLEGNLTWSTFNRICEAAGVKYKIEIVKKGGK